MKVSKVASAWEMVKETCKHWYADNTFLYGAALAFYTVSAIAPVVLVAIALASMVFGPEAAKGQVVAEIEDTVGVSIGQAIEDTLKATHDAGHGPVLATVGIILLMIGATTVFAQLQEALNVIWKVQPRPDRGILDLLKDRLLSFTIVIAIGFLLLVSLVFSAVLSALGKYVASAGLPGGAGLWHVLSLLVSFGCITVLFALIYRLLPDADIAWKHVWVGAVVTALLFTAGKAVISLYLGKSGVSSAYGAAGSLVVMLLWVYYSSQIFLFGAEFTYVYAHQSGTPVPPSANALPRASAQLAVDPASR